MCVINYIAKIRKLISSTKKMILKSISFFNYVPDFTYLGTFLADMYPIPYICSAQNCYIEYESSIRA